jgi:N-ethylmaleimide reductase
MGCSSSNSGKNLSLLSPFSHKLFKSPNRVVHAAMTRGRCDFMTSIPNDLLVQYYSKVAKNGCKLILTECSGISPNNAFCTNGSCYTDEQLAGWKNVVDAVHKEGAKIILQIFHGGRANHPDNCNGNTPFAPSPIAIRGEDHTMNGKKPHVEPTEMTEEQIKEVLGLFKKAAKSAIEIGFDGVQLHNANGYLLDQFTRSYTNRRTDNYGGSVENRLRFPLEVVDACIEAIGREKLGIKLSPLGRYNDMFDENPLETYTHFLKELNKRKIGFVEMMGPFGEDELHPVKPVDQISDLNKAFRSLYKGLWIANSQYDLEKGNHVIQHGLADLVSFGTKFISNPDLVRRFENGWKLNENINWGNCFYGGAEGYLDYPTYEEQMEKEKQPEN